MSVQGEERSAIEEALTRVIDPELSLNVVELGMVRGIRFDEHGVVTVQLALTSLACPVWDLFIDQVALALTDLCREPQVEFVTSPAWTPHDLTDEARSMLVAVGLLPSIAHPSK